jgi:3'(2'), 5'-bisphosphate nucleotidase
MSAAHEHAMRVAVHAARAGGAAAMPWYGGVRAEAKADASPVTQADLVANEAILAVLASEAPADAVLSEESADRPTRLGAARVWIVDPLDGTREFLARNGEFSVMVGLSVHGRAVAGAVYAPALGLLMYAAEGRGAWIEEDGGPPRLLRCAPVASPPRMVGSRSHAEPALQRVRHELGAGEPRVSGSVGLKCGLIARGECDLYVHPVPYLKEWDTCAPEVVLREAGGTVTDCRGRPLRYNKPETAQPRGILAAGPGGGDLLARVRAVLAGEAALAP